MRDVNTVNNLNNNTEYQKKLVKYLMQCLLSEGSKIIIFTLIFFQMHLLKEFIVALCLLMLLRTNGGGIHFQHYVSCFLVSFLMLFTSILAASHIPLHRVTMTIITLICIFAGYHLVPITSANRPPASNAVITKSKRHTLFIIMVSLILICRFPENLYIKIVFWTILLHILQLLTAKILMKGGAFK